MPPLLWHFDAVLGSGRPFHYVSGYLRSTFSEKGYNVRMNNISIADILELPVQERIRLVELIWDSVAAVPEAVEISPALKVELEARLAEFEANQIGRAHV